MKYILLLVLALVVVKAADQQVLFEADYSKYATQFEPFQKFLGNANPTTTAEVITEEGSQVLSFTKTPTKYFGVITSDWISSPSGNFYITVEFKGTANQRTGGFIGYVRDDALELQKPIGLDAKQNIEVIQRFRFNNTGTWNTYIAYLPLKPVGAQPVKIKLILEKGSYFGKYDNYAAKFRNIKVMDYTFTNQCEDAQQLTYQLGTIAFMFFNNEIQNEVFTTSSLTTDSKTGTFKFNYPAFGTPCLKTAFYGLDSAKKVIEKFSPTQNLGLDLWSSNQIELSNFEYTFTMNDIETLGCTQEPAKDSKNRDSIKYTCDYQLHFYYNHGQTFTTKQLQYDYTSLNSQAIFTSQFYVIVYKETSTILSTLIKTKEIDYICTGVCVINMDLTLALLIKNATDTDYNVPSGTQNVVWGDYIKFKIQSTPADYKLELMNVVVTTEANTIKLGDMFISSFVQNMNKNTNGQLTFEMMISGEAGLSKGKQFNLQFLTKTTAATARRLLDDSTLPDAQVSGQVVLNTKDEDSASQLTIGLLAMLLLLMLF